MKLVVYTVLVGDKEDLNNPIHYLAADAESDLDIEYLCFTDNLALTSTTWAFRDFSHPLMPPEKMSRRPKAMPNRYFPDCDYSLYIDNTVVFKRLPLRDDITGAVFRGFRHPWRTNPVDEADIVAKSGLDTVATVAGQLGYYGRVSPLTEVTTLTAGTVLLRKHHDDAVKRFGELWWEQILLFSKRDQISLDLCAQTAGCPVDYFAGDQRNNDLFIWPALPSGRRVLGSFDADRYAWENRTDPLALTQPRAHFLEQGGSAEKFDRRVSWFNYSCERTNSSLGDSAPPRRAIADIVGELLANLGDVPGRILICGLRSGEVASVDSAELVAAKAAVSQFFRFSNQPNVTLTIVGDEDIVDPTPFRSANGVSGFQLALVLGMPGKCHRNAMAKFLPLLTPNGRLLVEFGCSLDVHEILRMKEAVAEDSILKIFHGRHILSDELIASSVFVLALGRG
jgi:hypothetical protein